MMKFNVGSKIGHVVRNHT